MVEIFKFLGELGTYLAGLPEADRKKAMESMRVQHMAAETALVELEQGSAADLEKGKQSIHEMGSQK